MELFKITCVTCQANLSVRNESLIGQIVACPRCESMVQVERPTETAAALPSQPTEPELVSEPLQPTHVSQPTAEMETAVVEEPSVASDAVAAEEMAALSELAQASFLIANYQLLVWTIGAFVAGAALAGAVVLFRGDSPTNADVTVPIAPQLSNTETSAMIEEPTSEPAQSSPNTEVAATPEIPSSPAEPVVDRTEEDGSSTMEVADVSPVVVEPRSEAKPAPASDVPKVARRFDPLDFDPSSLDMATINTAGQESTPAESQSPETLSDADASVVPLPSTLPNVRRDLEQTVVPAVAEERLSQRFPAVKVNAMPLGDFLVLVSRLAGVPVSVAPEQLQMAGITARRTVSIEASDVALEEALHQVLEPLHLESVVEGPVVRVVRKDGLKLREVTYPLDDLSVAAGVDEIAGWVERLVAPTEWQTVGGAGTLTKASSTLKVKQAQWVQYRVLIFLERYRLACGLAPSSRFPVQKLAGMPAYAQLASRLNAPTTFTFSHYTALQDIVQHWQVELGVPILVDWPSLAEFDLWPQTRIACSTIEKPWHVALNEVLEPLGLGWRAVTGEMLEISTSQKVLTQSQLELYSLSRVPDAGVDRMLAELLAVSKPQAADAPPLRATAIEFDASARVLLVRLPAAEQRKVYDWLVENRLLSID